MKKLSITYDTKWIGCITLGIIGVVASLLFYMGCTQEASMTEEVIHYQYTVDPHLNYKVKLQPNLLSQTTLLGEDQSYIAEFVNGIETTFNYTLQSDQEVSIQGAYEIVAQTRGYSLEEGIKHTIWSKNYTVRPIQDVQYTGKDLMLSEGVSIDFLRHNTFAREVIQTTKVNMPVEFIVTMQGNLVIQVGEHIREEKINQSLVIPLGLSYFNITKEGVEPRLEQITSQIQTKVPLDKKKLITLATIDGLAIIGLLYIVFGTEVKKKGISIRKQSKKVFSEYGGYLVGIESLNEGVFQNEYNVYKMSDLIKVAEELEKPVLYRIQDEAYYPYKFYVVDEHMLYKHEIIANEEVRKCV